MRTPRGRGEAVLYLDFDGVLHPEEVWWHPARGPYLSPNSRHRLFEHAALLEEVLLPYPDLLLVLSTSWVRRYGMYGAAKRLLPSLRSRVIGATFHSEMHEDRFVATPRGVQVLQDVLRRKPASWLAVDDDYVDWPRDWLENFVRTDEVLGISEPSVLETLKNKLRQLCGGDKT